MHKSVRQYRPEVETILGSALVGNAGVVLAQRRLGCGDEDDVRVPPPNLRLGRGRYGSGGTTKDMAEAWRQAQTASQFCGLLGLGNVVHYDDLGILAALADIPQPTIASNPDVRAVAELASTSRGLKAVETLPERLARGSIREAAAALYLHHSSVGTVSVRRRIARPRARQAPKSAPRRTRAASVEAVDRHP